MDTCIIKTLSYFDIFDYPLTFEELKKYLCCEIDFTDDNLFDMINSISSIQESNGYYHLLGRQHITSTRSERSDTGIAKYAKAKIIAKILSTIPTIEYIGISGSLSMNNATYSDDIDLFFITKKNSLWITRFMVTLILYVMRQKRDKNGRVVRDKICPNMFMEVGKLSFSRRRKTLYTAHEIVQVKTIFDRNNTYVKFINQNKWVKEFLPNVKFPKYYGKRISTWERIFQKTIIPVEKLAFIFQSLYMGKSKSREVVSYGKAFFHPIDRQKLIMEMYELRHKRYMRLYEDNIWIDKDEARFYWEEKKIRILN